MNKKESEEKIILLEKQKEEILSFLVSLIKINENINKIDIFKFLVENLNYKASKEDIINICSGHLSPMEKFRFSNYVKNKYPEYYGDFRKEILISPPKQNREFKDENSEEYYY